MAASSPLCDDLHRAHKARKKSKHFIVSSVIAYGTYHGLQILMQQQVLEHGGLKKQQAGLKTLALEALITLRATWLCHRPSFSA
jgi:hypothetical protein